MLYLINPLSFSMVSLEEIRSAADLLKGQIIRTPLVYSPTFSEISGSEIYLKLETLQKAGSFKVRGAANRILSHRNEIGKAGVLAASAGNHAQGVAIAARMAGVHATIVMPEHVSISKQAATRGYGADVILKGQSLTDSIAFARQLVSEGMTFIHPYDDPDIIAGQGTIGLEIIEDLPDVDVIIVPVGGWRTHQRDSDRGKGD
jgi:threonine dehydratase